MKQVKTAMNKQINGNGDRDVMTPLEVSRYLKLPLSTIYKLSQEATLRGTKLGKHWRYLRNDIERYLTANRGNGGVSPGARLLGVNPALPEAPPIVVEKRRFPRIDCSLPSRFEIDIPQIKHCEGTGIVRNLSRGGALIEINEVRLEGQFIRVDDPILIQLDSGLFKIKIGEMEVQGRVVRLHENSKTKVGVEFKHLDTEMNQAIAAFVGGISWS